LYIKIERFWAVSDTGCVLITTHHTRSNKISYISDTTTRSVTLIHYWQVQQSAI